MSTSMMTAAAPRDAADVVVLCLERRAIVTDPAMIAIASNGSFASYPVLIEAKAIDINYFIPCHGDILGLVATSNRLSWAKFCLEYGSDPNLNKTDGYKSILAATAEHDIEDMAGLLLRHGARLQGSGAIVLAAEAGQTEMVRFLLTNGVEIDELGVEDPTDDESDMDIASALHKAISHGHVATALFLIDAGADIGLKDTQGRTPRELAERLGQTAVRDRMQIRGAKSSQAIRF